MEAASYSNWTGGFLWKVRGRSEQQEGRNTSLCSSGPMHDGGSQDSLLHYSHTRCVSHPSSFHGYSNLKGKKKYLKWGLKLKEGSKWQKYINEKGHFTCFAVVGRCLRSDCTWMSLLGTFLFQVSFIYLCSSSSSSCNSEELSKSKLIWCVLL